MQLPDVNLDAISDLATREIVQQLLNIIEALAAENAALRVENQQLRDENARLKVAQGNRTSSRRCSFLREEWFVPSTNTTILAPLPSGYHGGFSPTIQSLIPAYE